MCKKVLIACCLGRTEQLNIFALQLGISYIDSFHGNELAEAIPSPGHFRFPDLTPPQGVEGLSVGCCLRSAVVHPLSKLPGWCHHPAS